MKRRPARPQKPAPAQAKIPGRPVAGPAGGPVPARKPPPRHPAPAARPQPKIPGQPVAGAAGGPVKPAAKKKPAKRKLARPGESCVLDACYAIAGCRPDLDSEDGLFIPEALEVLEVLSLIAGFTPADLDSDLSRPGLVLGADLPGPHAVLVTPDGWRSWGQLWDPADFPAAVIEEAWQVTW